MSAKILIIDDEADIREMISSMLTMEGYRVINAADGQDNQALLKKLSIKNPLTQLIFFRYRRQCLEKELVRAERYRMALSLLMLDAGQAHRQGDPQGPRVRGRECVQG